VTGNIFTVVHWLSEKVVEKINTFQVDYWFDQQQF